MIPLIPEWRRPNGTTSRRLAGGPPEGGTTPDRSSAPLLGPSLALVALIGWAVAAR